MNTQYSASSKREALLGALGNEIRRRRTEGKTTIRELAEAAGVSERFLVQLEQGEGNISVARLADVASALDTTSSELLAHAESAQKRAKPRIGIVSLVGLRGAGKSTIGARLAKKMGAPFVELDALVAREAGMSLATIFEMHGENYFRNVERHALEKFLDHADSGVLATSGSIVSSRETYDLLRKRTTTVWLKARARDHWDRVVAQGDGRPMRDRANAMSELKALLSARTPLYSQADLTVDTSSISIEDAAEVIRAQSRPPLSARSREAASTRFGGDRRAKRGEGGHHPSRKRVS